MPILLELFSIFAAEIVLIILLFVYIMEESLISYFDCELVQGSNRVRVPIPYGALENMSRALLANNSGTFLEIHGVDMLRF